MTTNSQIILATFDSEAKAEDAVEELKQWDQYFKEVELGAIQMFTKDASGKLISRKLGKRAGGPGSKAGLILGVVAAVLSGGVTLLGGLAGGALLGGVTGSLFHRGLGLGKGEIERITADLDAGKAIIGVVTRDEQVKATVEVFESLGGKPQVVGVSDEAMEQLADTPQEPEQ